MKYWQLQKLCLENAYTVVRTGKTYLWKKNGTDRTGKCDTVVETSNEIKRDMDIERKKYDLARTV